MSDRQREDHPQHAQPARTAPHPGTAGPGPGPSLRIGLGPGPRETDDLGLLALATDHPVPAVPPGGGLPSPGAAAPPAPRGPAALTAAGAAWLASACAFPDSVRALWQHRPAAPSTLPCGTAFDVVSAPPLLGRRLLERLWSAGPGSGPVAVHRSRVLLFAAPGTAERLPALLAWGEWRPFWQPAAPQPCGRPHAPEGDAAPPPGSPGQLPHRPPLPRHTSRSAAAETFPPLLCHGLGDTVTVPAPHPHPGDPAARHSRWLVAPDVRHPWLPGAEALLWACVRSHRRPPAPRTAPGRSGDGRPGRRRTTDFRIRGS